MRLIEERRGGNTISYVYEPGSYVPLARLDADGEKTDQGGLGTVDDAQPPDAINSVAFSASQTGATGSNPSKTAADDAESRYWASLNETARQKAQALQIQDWGTGTERVTASADQAQLCKVYYFHTDQVGMPQELTNAQGQVIWQASYKTWGSTVAEEWEVKTLAGNPVHKLDEGDSPAKADQQQNLRFQGQYLDRDTGLHYNTFRYYDPDVGRFICPDPIGLAGGINLGSYSPNPLMWIDPWGWHCSGRDCITRGKNGEILTVTGTIRPSDIGKQGGGTATNQSSRDKARSAGNSKDDAGHTRPKNAGGSGGVDYTFPQTPSNNRGEFRVFEKDMIDYLKTTGRSVDFKQTHVYGNGGTRATEIQYRVYDGGVLVMGRNFPN